MSSPTDKADQPKKGKRAALDLSKVRSTKVDIGGLGNVELKRASLPDAIEFAKMLEEETSDRAFVAKVLAQQVIRPKIDYKKLESLPDVELEELARAFARSEKYTFKHLQDTGDYFRDFRQAIKTSHEEQIEELRKTIEPIIKSAQKTLTAFKRNHAHIQESLRGINELAKRVSESIKPAIEQFGKSIRWLEELEKAGLTPNLGEDRSYRKLKQYLKLLNCGYPIFWVPRANIIEKLLNCKDEKGRKAIVLANKDAIIDDCEGVLNSIRNRELRDSRAHLESSIAAFRQRNCRAAQSAAAICFDAQLDQIVDVSQINHFSQVRRSVKEKSKQLVRAYGDVPAYLIFAALQAHIITNISKGFDRIRPRTVRLKYDRDSSIHSVSARQYGEFNALLAIMAGTSLLATTERLGKGWLSKL